MKTLTKIGHRGASGYFSENTLKAVDKAVEMGADMVEIDVRVIKSGEVIVFHDDTLDRMTSQKGNVEDLAWEELEDIKINGNHHIPKLADVMTLLHNRCRLNIEIKNHGAYHAVQKVIEESNWNYEDLEVASFEWEELRSYKREFPQIPICVLTGTKPIEKAINFAREISAVSVNPLHTIITRHDVQEIKKAGFEVATWTVNAPEDIEKVKTMGVDAVITDYLDRL